MSAFTSTMPWVQSPLWLGILQWCHDQDIFQLFPHCILLSLCYNVLLKQGWFTDTFKIGFIDTDLFEHRILTFWNRESVLWTWSCKSVLCNIWLKLKICNNTCFESWHLELYYITLAYTFTQMQVKPVFCKYICLIMMTQDKLIEGRLGNLFQIFVNALCHLQCYLKVKWRSLMCRCEVTAPQ